MNNLRRESHWFELNQGDTSKLHIRGLHDSFSSHSDKSVKGWVKQKVITTWSNLTKKYEFQTNIPVCAPSCNNSRWHIKLNIPNGMDFIHVFNNKCRVSRHKLNLRKMKDPYESYTHLMQRRFYTFSLLLHCFKTYLLKIQISQQTLQTNKILKQILPCSTILVSLHINCESKTCRFDIYRVQT